MKLIRILMTTLACMVGACATNLPQPTPNALADLAPTGKLRVGLPLDNIFLGARDAGTMQYSGVAPDLGRSLAAHLGKPFEPIAYADASALVASVGKNEWDVAFLALHAAPASAVDFSQPYMEADFSYLVPVSNTRIRTVADVDQPGIRVAAQARSNALALLERSIKRTQIVPSAGGKIAILEALTSAKADAYAESAHVLIGLTKGMTAYRVLDGRYAAAEYVILLPKGKPEGLKFVNAFLDAARASGEIDRAIKNAGLTRVRVPVLPKS